MNDLGIYLKRIRKSRLKTLREVEAATGISNAYLSQIENGKIKKPSCNILWKLAECYLVPYETLMEKSGQVTPIDDVSFATNNLGELTEQEETEILKFLEFLRYKELNK